jgi:choline-glycine betaine transporter
VISGGTINGATTFGGIVSSSLKSMTVSGSSTTYSLTQSHQLEDVECFMPQKEFDDWMKWVTTCFTWLYIITQDVWIVFAVYLWASKYGTIKLGKDDDEPEFTYFAWFSMLFTCGVATGLFYFAVSEPLYYYLVGSSYGTPTGYSERNRWTYSGVYVDGTGSPNAVWNTPNDRAQNAMTTTWYHWGLHGWVCYCLLGVLLALLHFRKGLPMTIKSCFYPLIGTNIYGFIGDFLDTISVVATTMGVCTSLGLGVIQLNSGLELLNGDQMWLGEAYYNQYNIAAWRDQESDLKGFWDSWETGTKSSNPWSAPLPSYDIPRVVTSAVATTLTTLGATVDCTSGSCIQSTYPTAELSTIATAGKVAKVNSQTNQQMLLIWIITASATGSVMLGLKNGIKQLALLCLGLGQFCIFYVWMMDDTWFLSNLFIQTCGHYIGTLPVIGFYASAVEQSEVNNPYGEYSSWQFWWTIFYWGWWIAWAPFVGVFLARVGKGRTVREFVFCTLFSACLYNFIFMTILGGAGLKMQMLAEKHAVGTGASGSTNSCTAKKLEHTTNSADSYITVAYKENVCRATSTRKYSGESEMFCSTITNLGCSLKADGTRPLFDVLTQYGDVAKGMTVVLLITITLYFVASSDSGSMVDDMVTANGLPEPCLSQRLFWALTEGAAASALLSVGKYVGKPDGGLKALRSASICVGLPYTFLICFMCVALYRALQYEMGDRKWKAGFKSQIIDIGITLYDCKKSREPGSGKRLCCFNIKGGKCDFGKLAKIALYTVCPVLPILKIIENTNKYKKRPGSTALPKVGGVIMMVFFFMWFLFQFLDHLPISENLQEWGSVVGNPTTLDGNTRYYLSNRWGYYHQWANKDSDRDAGQTIQWNRQVSLKGQERPLTATINFESEAVGVGERFAFNYRIAVIGWFFMFMFIVYLVSLRSEIRVVCAIQGTLMEDFLVCCLWANALWQMEETIAIGPQKAAEGESDTI